MSVPKQNQIGLQMALQSAPMDVHILPLHNLYFTLNLLFLCILYLYIYLYIYLHRGKQKFISLQT